MASAVRGRECAGVGVRGEQRVRKKDISSLRSAVFHHSSEREPRLRGRCKLCTVKLNPVT